MPNRLTPAKAARDLDYLEKRLADPQLPSHQRDRLKQIAEHRLGVLKGHCRRCGRKIEHPDSIRDGLGRTCVHRAAA